MSRRKQSNPKPFKRLSDDEDDEADMKSTESQKLETDVTSPCSTTSNEPNIHSKQTIKSEPIGAEVVQDNDDETNRDEKSPVIFLNDVLILKKVEKDEAQQMGRSFLVCSAIPLPKGSSIGPFDAEIVSLSSIRQGDMVLQAQEDNGETSFVRVEDPNATWLTMLRPAPSESVRNTSVFYKGGQIWCEIISELKVGTELLSSFTIQESSKSEPCSPDSSEYKENDEIDMEVKAEVLSPPSLIPTSPITTGNVINHAALLYGCPFCGVRFSSARTLEGHLTYYCSKKPSTVNAEKEMAKQTQADNKETEERMQTSPSDCDEDERQEKQNNESSENKTETETSDPKVLKSGELFHCPFCSYRSDKLSSLNRHKRIHCRGSNSPTSSTSSVSPASKQDSYCAECNIQFSSFSTFKCHKEFYCSRRLDGIGVGMSSVEKSPTTPTSKEFPSISFHEQMSPNTVKNLKQFIAVSSGSIMSGQTNVILAPPIIARGLLNIPYGMPTVIVQPVVPPSPSSLSPGSMPTNKIKLINETPVDQPLDLSVSKKSSPMDDSNKENSISSKNISPDYKLKGFMKREQTSKSNSPVLSSPSGSPRQRNRSTSVNSGEKTPPSSPSTSNRISPYIGVPPVQFIGGKPIPPVPHSVSKCVDCNIVFYKHENFIIHKKHYCSSRQTRSDSSENFDDDSKDSSEIQTLQPNGKIPTMEIAKTASSTDKQSDSEKSKSPTDTSEATNHKESRGVETKTDRASSSSDGISSSEPTNTNYFCNPCNIRFSSTSTLSAHKQFYCPYLQEINKHPPGSEQEEKQTPAKCLNGDYAISKCDRCGISFPSAKILRLHYCTGMASHAPLLRCPYCDYVTQTENRITEHLKVHMPSKAYRCTLCGYRGNTVRGMRMHGKMHIDNGEEFSDEHMVEIEEPPLVPVIFNNPIETASTNVEAELIRLKNEPYKRRRSRKSYEKSEHMGNIRESTPKSVCVYCGQPFNDGANLAMHIRIHEMVAFHAASSRNLKCHFCDHVAETFPSLMVHVEHKHLKDVDSNKKEDSGQHSPSSISPKRSASDSDADIVHSPKRSRKESKSPEDSETRTLSPRVSKADHATPKHMLRDAERERTLDLLNLAGKIKSEPIENDSDGGLNDQKENLNNNELHRKRKHSSSDLSTEKRSQSGSPSDKMTLKHFIKPEKINGSDELPSPLRSPVLNPELARYYQLAMQVMPPLVIPRVQKKPLPSPSERTEKLSPSAKYCKYCDISFTYLSTYVAHKKYYCTTRQPEEMSSPAKA